MKMAKASETDIRMALDLASALEEIESGYFPTNLQANCDAEIETSERIDTTDRQQYERLIWGLQNLLRTGSLFRVVFGMAVICDPANELINPDTNVLEHHPKRQKMESALLWALYHHQGASSVVGQPIRKLLGLGQYDRLTDEHIAQAKEFGQGGAA